MGQYLEARTSLLGLRADQPSVVQLLLIRETESSPI